MRWVWLKKIGYDTLLLYAKNQPHLDLDLEPEVSIEQLKQRILAKQTTCPIWRRLQTMKQRFALHDSEVYLVFLVLLQQLDVRFYDLFCGYSKQSCGLTLPLAQDIYQINQQATTNWDYQKLSTLLFSSLDNVTLKSHVVHYLRGTLYERSIDKTPSDWIYDTLQMTADRIAKQDGHFYFSGCVGIGRKTCFRVVLQQKQRQGIWIEDKAFCEQKLFFAVCEHYAVGITQSDCLTIAKPYLPYLDFVVAIGTQPLAPSAFITILFEPLDTDTRYAVWQQQADRYAFCVDLQKIANQYVLTVGEIQNACKEAVWQAQYQQLPTVTSELIYQSIHQILAHKISHHNGVKQIPYTLDDVVLPARQMRKIEEAIGQVLMKHTVMEEFGLQSTMAYGKGLSVLFVGPPGTGKTMSAHAFANRLDAVLYQVDLATVVSKFIGETEKNLKRIFDQARLTQTVLFFDEADILFSKRTEVKDASDKYSNMEAAFLLQEIENYEGVTLLATNFLQNIDEAFKRRMKFIIEFPFPAAPQRLALFQQAIPPRLTVSEEVDLPFLAERFELSGGNIKNVIYNACCLCACQGSNLTMRALIRAVILEYEKMGKQLGKHDFGSYESLVDG